MPTRQQIENAFQQYMRIQDGKDIPPWRITRNIDWFVIADNGEPFPVKYIYGLASDIRPSSFHTGFAKRRLRELGFYVVPSAKIPVIELELEVSKASKDRDARLKRLLNKANQVPRLKVVTQVEFMRDPDVVAEALYLAQGRCQICCKPAPFLKRNSNDPFLEVHHKTPLSEGGTDTVDNAVALCPNCHRQEHFGIPQMA